jgi:hypothetical protein
MVQSKIVVGRGNAFIQRKDREMFRKNMLWMYVVVFVVILVLFFAGKAQAEDNVLGFCTDTNAVNFIGNDIIKLYEDTGFTVVDDGSCYYLDCNEVTMEDGTVIEDAWSCQEATNGSGNYNNMISRLLADQPAPQLEIVEGCLDPSADNYMNPIFWTGYEITEANWTCIYPEPIIIEPENAL